MEIIIFNLTFSDFVGISWSKIYGWSKRSMISIENQRKLTLLSLKQNQIYLTYNHELYSSSVCDSTDF